MKFEYKDIGSRRKRPFIPITLRNPKNHKEVQCYALVDSGSDCNLFSPVLGEIIGIDVQNGIQRPIAGVVAGEKISNMRWNSSSANRRLRRKLDSCRACQHKRAKV